MKKILVATDFSPLATEALRYAAKLAAKENATLSVVYADTFEPPVEFTSREVSDVATSIEESRRRAKEELERCIGQNVPANVSASATVAEGPPVTAILREADRIGADAIVVGTHGRSGLQRLLLGSVSAHVAAEARVPVIVVPAPTA